MARREKIFFLGFFLSSIYPYDLQVKILNATLKKEQKVESISLLIPTQRGRERIREEKGVSSVLWRNLPKEAPFWILRAKYQGIVYTQSIKPQENAQVLFKVYEKKFGISSKVSHRALYHFLHRPGRIEVLSLLYFQNPTLYTFLEKGGGIFFYLPPQGEIQQVRVSLAASREEFSWLKIPFQKKEEGKYLLLYPIKPGEWTFEILYSIPYKEGKRISLEFFHPYFPQEIGILRDPPSMKIFFQGEPLSFSWEEFLEKEVALIKGEKRISLVIESKNPLEEERIVSVRELPIMPYSLKIGIGIGGVVLLFLFFFFRERK